MNRLPNFTASKVAPDEAKLAIFKLKHESLGYREILPPPDETVREIIEDLGATPGGAIDWGGFGAQ